MMSRMQPGLRWPGSRWLQSLDDELFHGYAIVSALTGFYRRTGCRPADEVDHTLALITTTPARRSSGGADFVLECI
jgi:hypothetical protein